MIVLLVRTNRRIVKCIVVMIRLLACVGHGYVAAVRSELAGGRSRNIVVSGIVAMIEMLAGVGKKPGERIVASVDPLIRVTWERVTCAVVAVDLLP